MNTSDPLRSRRVFAAMLLLLGFASILTRLFYLQVLHAAELTAQADRQHQKTVTVEGGRGAIVDRQGKVLAVNMDVPSVFGIPTSLDNPSGIAHDLARVLHVRPDDIERKLKQERSFVWIARKLDPDSRIFRWMESVSSWKGAAFIRMALYCRMSWDLPVWTVRGWKVSSGATIDI
jgi:cell division protein FtsI/penicillin-binding protein 2